MPEVQLNQPTTSPNTLNVVFHGAFVFALREDFIEVLTPQTDGHAHYAGPWKEGGLHPLKKLPNDGSYELKYDSDGGAHAPAAPTFDPVKSIIVNTPLAKDYQNKVQSSWKLPFPSKPIATLQRVSILAGNITGRELIPPGLVHIPEEVSTVWVFIYDLKGSTPRVEGLPEWVPETGVPVVNLHVFAEETHRWLPQRAIAHPQEEFQKLTELMDFGRVVPPGFGYVPREIPLVEPNDELPRGLRNIELVPLAVSGLVRDSTAVAPSGDSGNTVGHPCVPIGMPTPKPHH